MIMISLEHGCFIKILKKKLFKFYFFYVLDYFNILILKIIFKNKKYYFNIKTILKNMYF